MEDKKMLTELSASAIFGDLKKYEKKIEEDRRTAYIFEKWGGLLKRLGTTYVHHDQNDDLFESKCEALVNAVNCVGVMGGGIALDFKIKFPDMYEEYRDKCNYSEINTGKMHVYQIKNSASTTKYIINFPTKSHYIYRSKMEYIETGLQDLRRVIEQMGIKSVAMPALGCGLGGLNWEEVSDAIKIALADMTDLEVHLYEPKG